MLALAGDLEGGLALAEAQRELLGGAEQPLDLLEGPRRHQHGLVVAQHAGAREVAHREPVGVGGHQAQATVLGGEQHTGEDGPGVVATGRGDDLAQRGREVGRLEGHRLLGRLREPRVLVGGQQPDRGLEAPRRDVGLVAFDGDGDGTGLERAHHLGRDAPGEHGDAVGLAVDLGLDRDGQLEVGAREQQAAAGELEPHPGEHGQRAATVGGGSSGGAERFDEEVTLTSELHAVPTSFAV